MNRYNQVPHLTQDTNGKRTNSQLDATDESKEVSPFPTGDHKAQIKDAHKCIINTRQKNINEKYHLGMVSKNNLLEGLNRFHIANLNLNSDVDQEIDIWFA